MRRRQTVGEAQLTQTFTEHAGDGASDYEKPSHGRGRTGEELSFLLRVTGDGGINQSGCCLVGFYLKKYVAFKMITSPFELLTSIKYREQMETNRRKNILISISIE